MGGIVSITAGDFEKINGFPNYWAWGYEDNMLNKRVLKAELQIDRSNFYNISDKNIIHFLDGTMRNINRKEFDKFLQNTNEGIQSIKNINYETNDFGFVNVSSFNTNNEEDLSKIELFDLRNGRFPYGNSKKVGMTYINKKVGMTFINNF